MRWVTDANKVNFRKVKCQFSNHRQTTFKQPKPQVGKVYFSHKFSYMLRKVISFTLWKNHFHLLQENPIKNLNPNRNLTQFPTAFIFSIFVKYEMKGKNTTLQHNVIDNIHSHSSNMHACNQYLSQKAHQSSKRISSPFKQNSKGPPKSTLSTGEDPFPLNRPIFFHFYLDTCGILKNLMVLKHSQKPRKLK